MTLYSVRSIGRRCSACTAVTPLDAARFPWTNQRRRAHTNGFTDCWAETLSEDTGNTGSEDTEVNNLCGEDRRPLVLLTFTDSEHSDGRWSSGWRVVVGLLRSGPRLGVPPAIVSRDPYISQSPFLCIWDGGYSSRRGPVEIANGALRRSSRLAGLAPPPPALKRPRVA